MKEKEDILTPKEASNYLKLSLTTIYRLSRKGKIPSYKIGKSWRINKLLLDNWIKKKIKE